MCDYDWTSGFSVGTGKYCYWTNIERYVIKLSALMG